MLLSFLIGAAIGAVIGAAIAEIEIYIEGCITAEKIREEARQKAALRGIKEFLVKEINNTYTGPTIKLSGKNNCGETVANITVSGSSTNLWTNQTF